MKNSKSFIMCAIMITFFINSTYESDRVAQKLTNAAPKVFGSFKMFSKPIDVVELKEWDAVISEGLAFVQAANKNSKKSQEYSKSIIDANNSLINTIKLTYNMIFLPYQNTGKLLSHESKIILNEKNKCTVLFTKIQDDMANLIKEIKSKKFFASDIVEKDVLIEIAKHIASYADNAMNSMEFKLSTENKISADSARPWVARL